MIKPSAIGTIFLDKDLRITHFTPVAREVLKLSELDSGMPFREIVNRCALDVLIEDVAEVMEKHHPVSREIAAADGRFLIVNLSPTGKDGMSLEGVAVTIVEADVKAGEPEVNFRTIADAVPQLIWTNEAGGRANYFNHRWYEYSGLTYAQSEGLGWQAMVHPEDGPPAVREWNAALSKGEIFDTEYRLLGADGNYRWFIGRNVPLHDDAGNITGWFGTATEVQELKLAEQSLRDSEERLRVTLESATDYAIITTNGEGIITGWSRGAELILGWTEAEILGQDVAIIFTPEDRACGRPVEERALAVAQGFSIDERWHLRKDGTRFFMSGVVRPIIKGTLTGFVKIARDLTERRQAEETIRISEERYRTSLQAAEMGAWDWNMVDNTVVWNEQYYLMLGLPPEESAHDTGQFLRLVHPEDIPAVSIALKQAAEETGIYQAEFRIIRADNGATHWMSGFGRAVSHADGHPTRMLGVVYDITARRRLEEQREEFIGNASHELKTPLAALKAYAEVLQDIFSDAADDQSASLILKMEGQIDRLTQLIRALLDVTSVREGRLELRTEIFDLATLVEEVADDISLTTTQRIEVQIMPAYLVEADRERIRQVIINLLSNAIKYSPDADRTIVSSKEEGGNVIVCVQDFGIGMSKEVAARVFERFYRADDAFANTYPGLGLGLYISAEIVNWHRGRMWVESRKGEGSTFCFSLPAVH